MSLMVDINAGHLEAGLVNETQYAESMSCVPVHWFLLWWHTLYQHQLCDGTAGNRHTTAFTGFCSLLICPKKIAKSKVVQNNSINLDFYSWLLYIMKGSCTYGKWSDQLCKEKTKLKYANQEAYLAYL